MPTRTELEARERAQDRRAVLSGLVGGLVAMAVLAAILLAGPGPQL
jgi:hypothetical protein